MKAIADKNDHQGAMNGAFLNFESQPGRLIVNVKGSWIFDEVLALENATASVLPETGQLVAFQ